MENKKIFKDIIRVLDDINTLLMISNNNNVLFMRGTKIFNKIVDLRLQLDDNIHINNNIKEQDRIPSVNENRESELRRKIKVWDNPWMNELIEILDNKIKDNK
jgi:hypothetical protein